MEASMNTQKYFQRTLQKPISFVGRGLHSGKKSRITLRPCDDGSGIFFRRKDVTSPRDLIAARWYKITDTTLSTVLSNSAGTSIATVEHLMAALSLYRIANLEIEVDGPEIPIMDGSARAFVETLLSSPVRETELPEKVLLIQNKVAIHEGDKYAELTPDSQPRVTVAIDFKEKAIGRQTYSLNLDDPLACKKVAAARTFGFLNQIEALHKKGLALGGSLNNAILVDNDRVVNAGGLRYKNEFVRHKVLDAIGDMALVGFPIIGHYQAYKAGHLLNKRLIGKLIRDKSAWSLLSRDEFYQLYGNNFQQNHQATGKNTERHYQQQGSL